MSDKKRKLNVEGDLGNITRDQLNILFKNKRAQGGGPVEDVQISEDKKSAVIIFKDPEAVDLIMSRGDIVVINDIQLKVSRLFDVPDLGSHRAETNVNDTVLPSEPKQLSKSFSENASAEIELEPTSLSKKTNKLKVIGFPEDVTKDQLTILFKNKRGQGGGPVEAINISEDKTSAVIIFKETEAVDLVMSRGDTVIFSGIPLKVSPLYDETDTSPKAITEISEMLLSSGIKSNNSAENVSAEAKLIPTSLSKKTNKLKVTGFPEDVTKDQLIILFKNKRGQGGGPVEAINISEDKTSAAIIFKETEAVDLVMSRGDTVIFSGIPLKVSPLYDETDTSPKAITEISEMLLSSGIKSNNSAENVSAEAKLIPTSLSKKTNKLKVTGFPEDVTKDQLIILFKNKRGQGGGPVEAINISEDKTSAAIIFKETEAVDLVMSRGDTVIFSGIPLKVSPLYDETDTSPKAITEISEMLLSSGIKSNNSAENVSAEAKLIPTSLSKKTNKLKVIGFPEDVTKDQLTILFKNKRGQGGGPVEAINISEDKTSAVIIFKETEAVDLVVSRGDTVIFSGIPLKVSPLYDETDASSDTSTDISEIPLSSEIKSESSNSSENVSREVEFIPRSLPKKTNKLLVRGIPDSVTKDHLNIFFKNKKRLGGGPVEEIVFLEDKTSAVIIFKENEAVDLVMSRGETVIFSSSPLNVSPFYDETDDSCEAKTEIIEMPLSSGIKSESNNSAEIVSSGDKLKPSNSSMKTNKLKVSGIPEQISKDQLSLLFKNKRGQGGGPVEAINLTEDGTSAVVIFKESEAVDLVMSRGSTVTISKVSLEVSPLYDETDDSTCTNSEMSEIKLSSKTNSKSKHSSENVSSGDKLKPSSSSKKTNKLKVTGLPDEVTKDQLHIFFKNKRGQGGGQIEAIHIPKDGTNAIVIFKKTEAVDLIMSRGNTVTYFNTTLTVKPYYKEITTETPEAQDNITEDSEMHMSIKQKKRKPKVENRKMSTNMVTSDSEGSCTLTEKEKEKPLSFKKMEKEKTKTLETPPSKKNDKDKQEDTTEFALHNTTVKIKLHSIDTCKDTYIYYLEDESLNIGPFHEESLMLDGLHNIIYVTFHTQKDAKSFCQKKHPPDLEISKVEMATEEDFKTYPNYIFLKGNLENLGALAEQINEKTGLEVSDIIQEDDLDACIVKLDPRFCDDITQLTWTLTSVGSNKMITAPVYKKNCVSVSGLTPDVSIPTLKRYLENKKRSGGGKTKSLVQIAEDEVVVYFEDDVDLTALISREDHTIEHTDLIISRYYPCLSRNYMKKDDSLKVKPDKNQPLPSKTFSKKKQLQLNPGSLMSVYIVKKQGPIFVGVLTLTPYAFPYLKGQKHKLENIAREAYCEMTLFPQMLQLKLNWPEKLEAKEVKQKLENGLKEISNYLKQFAVLTFTMNESEAQHFQHFCTGKVDIFYHEESSKMIVINLDSQTSLKALIHHLYDEFIQQGKDQQDASRLIEIKKKLSLSEGAEKINVSTDISKAKSELKVSVEEKTFQHSEEVSLDKFEIKLLEKCLFFDQFKETYKETKINLDNDTNKVILMGNDRSQLNSIHLDILNKCKQDVGFSKLESVTADQMKLLKKDNVQKKVDSMLDNCYMQCNENDVKLYYLKSGSVNISDAEKKIRSQVEVTKKPINQDMLKILESSDGSTFLSSLTDPNSGFNTVIQLDSNNQELMIICPGDQIYQLNKSVDNYLETNKLHQKEISLSYGKQQFINKYLMEELNHLKSSLGRDATLEFLSDKCLIKGLRDPVSNCEVHINQLVSKIDKNDVQLNFFGIDEFLHDPEGKSLLREIEETHRCVIQFKSEAKKAPAPKVAIKPPTLIAKCSLRDVNISFFQGNIFGLKADAVVNPLDSSFQFVSAINRELIQQGGLEIQREFERSNTSSSVGSVVETSSGSLSKVKNIIHAVCPVYLDYQQEKELELTVKACLHHAANKNYSTISLPTVGLGKILKFPLLPACKILLESIKSSLESGRHSFKDIFLCDVNSDNIKEIMDRFEAQGIEIEHFNKPTDKKEPTKSHSRSPPKSFAKKSWDFKNMKVDIVLGEINKQDTDIIVITVDKSLDLSKGRLAKTILREAGDDIQNELLNRFSDGVRTGDFAESSGGNLQCKHIFHACLSRFRGDTVQMEHLVYKLLEGANRLKAKSISLPALGTGNLGYSPEDSAEVIMKTIENFAAQNPHFSLKISIVVFPRDTDVAQAFKSARESFATGGQSDIEEEASSASYFGSFKKHLASYFSKAPTDNKGIQKYGNVSLKIKQGDITKERNSDVIVNGIKDSMDLSHSGQVCKTLLKICGQELQDECSRKIDEMKTDGLVVTSAPKLQCKNIIHISQDQFSKCLDKGVTKILLEAEKIGASTLSLPVLGAGSRHANHHSIKKSILSAIEQFGNSGAKKLTKIKLVIFDPHVFNVFMGHGEAKVHSSHDKSIANMPPISVSQKAELVIYSDSAEQRMLAEKKLKEKCKAAFKEEKDTEQNLTKLSNAQIKSLEYLGLQNRIKVTVRAQEHLLITEGFQPTGMLQVHKQLKKLVVEAVGKHHMSLLHAVPSSIEWQYKQGDKWRSFDSVLNSETEREFKNKSDTFEITDMKGRKISINFKKMKETFQEEQGGKQSFDIRRYDKTKSVSEPLPRKWDKMSKGENLKMVQVQPGSEEYTKVEQHFTSKGGNLPIKKIERIQNKALYQQFSVKKRDIDAHNPKGHQNELKLFHGTAAQTVPFINENGFDRSHCGVNGTAYGKGVYFALNSSYSVGYAKSDILGNRYMYVARVLTGENVTTNGNTQFLPNKPGTNRPYDSGGSIPHGIYVIFHDAQVYPEYLITF
ncbi:protein mono-ADP-ribosyltransferase PARP14-like isoform X3 [Biomphalaria glabrata]|nr:protein mono-ADP-ribosyltransferase PARP14-like isoform X3 [Biomphalaria glabrata]XP_055874101.1 protein mono-ADP-ribosyltransferase PARP14-like isoform X3 [Biomphalaria glabrata]XP_055874102.1 protein mono-ADP-ribosyltransferase PARP14-like isoform X3 [Biomphalaria glabrata]XP_055874103.1 protein mono-ADP-ribosyltransferase PARP14-like isoform X3 [Biomphalaria glabrata]